WGRCPAPAPARPRPTRGRSPRPRPAPRPPISCLSTTDLAAPRELAELWLREAHEVGVCQVHGLLVISGVEDRLSLATERVVHPERQAEELPERRDGAGLARRERLGELAFGGQSQVLVSNRLSESLDVERV